MCDDAALCVGARAASHTTTLLIDVIALECQFRIRRHSQREYEAAEPAGPTVPSAEQPFFQLVRSLLLCSLLCCAGSEECWINVLAELVRRKATAADALAGHFDDQAASFITWIRYSAT